MSVLNFFLLLGRYIKLNQHKCYYKLIRMQEVFLFGKFNDKYITQVNYVCDLNASEKKESNRVIYDK